MSGRLENRTSFRGRGTGRRTGQGHRGVGPGGRVVVLPSLPSYDDAVTRPKGSGVRANKYLGFSRPPP